MSLAIQKQNKVLNDQLTIKTNGLKPKEKWINISKGDALTIRALLVLSVRKGNAEHYMGFPKYELSYSILRM